MSRIHIARDRQSLGQFDPGEVAEGLRSGRFLPTDLAWREGMESWQPLSTFANLPVAPEAEPPADLAPGSDLIAPEPRLPDGPAQPEWERMPEVGVIRAVFGTIRQVFTNPVGTFRDMKKTGGFLWPLVYCYCLGVVCGLTGTLFSIAWTRVLPPESLPHLGEDPFRESVAGLVFTIPLIFGIGLIAPFFMSGVHYLIAKLLAAKEEIQFETVFRAYCYVNGSVAVIGLLPLPPLPIVQIVFLLFVFVMLLAYLTLAFRESLSVPTFTAFAVAAMPIAICCFCGVGAIASIAVAANLPGMEGFGG